MSERDEEREEQHFWEALNGIVGSDDYTWEEGARALDAHLKEDAEREQEWVEAIACSPGCGDLSWTLRQHGRITHKHSCWRRVEAWCQTHPTGCESPVEKYEAELTELAELCEKHKAEMRGQEKYHAEVSYLRKELTELRAENTRLNYELGAADYPGKKQLVAELTELREAVRALIAAADRGDDYGYTDASGHLRQLLKGES